VKEKSFEGIWDLRIKKEEIKEYEKIRFGNYSKQDFCYSGK